MPIQLLDISSLVTRADRDQIIRSELAYVAHCRQQHRRALRSLAEPGTWSYMVHTTMRNQRENLRYCVSVIRMQRRALQQMEG